MRHCCVPLCGTRTDTGDASVSFHEIPSDDVLRSHWLDVIGRKAWPPNYAPARATVCSKHFLPKDYKEGCKRRTLRKGAVPSIVTARAPHKQAATSPGYRSSSPDELSLEGHEIDEDSIPSKKPSKEFSETTCDDVSVDAAGENFYIPVPCTTVGHDDVASSADFPVLNTPHDLKPSAERASPEPGRLNAVPVELTTTVDVSGVYNPEPASPTIVSLPRVNAALEPTAYVITAYGPHATSTRTHVLSQPGSGRTDVDTASARQNGTPSTKRSHGSQTDPVETLERQEWKRKERAIRQKISTLKQTMERYKEEVRRLKKNSGLY